MKGYIKMDPREIHHEWTELHQERVQWWAFVIMYWSF